MIDEKKLIEQLRESNYHHASNSREEVLLDRTIRIVLEQPKVGEWIPVDERLPENCSSVLMYSILRGVEQGCYSPSTDTWVMFRWGVLTGKVTHWKPLPEGPEPYSSGTRKNSKKS